MHHDCLLDDVLARLYERLGTDKPHVERKRVKTETEDDENDDKPKQEPQAPLSPTEVKSEETQPTIAVRGSEISDSSGFKPSDEETASSKLAAVATATQKPASDRKPPGKRRRASAKMYKDLFEATLRMNDGPMAWKIRDLRNVGGSETWTEPAHCLVCGTTIV